jgi:hypothetical protein
LQLGCGFSFQQFLQICRMPFGVNRVPTPPHRGRDYVTAAVGGTDMPTPTAPNAH